MKRWIFGCEALNVTLLLIVIGVFSQVVLAQEAAVNESRFMAAAISTGLAAIGAGIAVGIAGAAAIGAVAEKPELLGRTLIFVGLAEGIAIYGLIISFMVLGG